MDTRIIVSFLIGAALIFLATGSLAPGPAAPEEPAILAGVPDVRQAEQFSCGASSMQAVLSYWGLDSFEADLRVYLNTSPTTAPTTGTWSVSPRTSALRRNGRTTSPSGPVEMLSTTSG